MYSFIRADVIRDTVCQSSQSEENIGTTFLSLLHFLHSFSFFSFSTLGFTQRNVYCILEDQHIKTGEIDIPERTYKAEVSLQLVNNLNIAWHVKRHKKGNQFQN